MENKKINAKNLYVAQLRYFDQKENGTLIPVEKVYAVLTDITGKYENIINPGENLPVYGRLPYTNTTLDGEDYGTKLYLAEGEVTNGLCYVLESNDFSRFMPNKTEYTLEDIEDIIVGSDLLFKDRIDILKRRQLSLIAKLRAKKIIASDTIRLQNFESLFNLPEGKIFEKK